MRRAAFAFGMIALALAAWTACVGDEPTSSNNQGAQDQPCYANGTCLMGLTCENGRCKSASAEGGAQTSSGGTSSGGSSSSSSSGATCPASVAQDGPTCGSEDAGACPKGQTCCAADGGGFSCSATCTPGWQCEDGTKQCDDAQGHICCVTVTKQTSTDTCGAKTFADATSRCVQNASDCVGLKDYRVCNTVDDCVGGAALKSCVRHDVETVSGSRFALGLCEAR